jgi:hypothetical protein
MSGDVIRNGCFGMLSAAAIVTACFVCYATQHVNTVYSISAEAMQRDVCARFPVFVSSKL